MGREINHEKDELLELLWHLDESHTLSIEALREHDPTNIFERSLREFSTNGIVNFDGRNVALTESGYEAAKGIVRRHRLAERLMVDVLGRRVEDTEQAACEFEHILAPELVDSICILLGHPKQCPHGSPIPEGGCCNEARSSVESAVVAVTSLKPGTSAKVAFISTRDEDRMYKLLSMGITPGTSVKLHQTAPVLVLEVEQNQIALENSVGSEIRVWRATPGSGRKAS
ncbi:MAG: metal-dependent transcriptional regulator [Nitrospirota bacterium]|nr:metal-dependent transcriptional regulator [Nitrospirota bacterium]